MCQWQQMHQGGKQASGLSRSLLDFRSNLGKPQDMKTQGSLRMVKHLLGSNHCDQKKIEGLAGNLLEVVRSNAKMEGSRQESKVVF